MNPNNKQKAPIMTNPSHTTQETIQPKQDSTPSNPQTSQVSSDSEVSLSSAFGSQVGVIDQFSEGFTANALETASAQAAQLAGLVLNYPKIVNSLLNQQLSQAVEDGTLGKSAMCPRFKASSRPLEQVAMLLQAGQAASLNPAAVNRLKALPSASQDG
jgi:hypothetical protein